MASLPTLSANALQRIQDGDTLIQQPVLQILQMKRMNSETDVAPRFKMLFTDGITCMVGMATGNAGESITPIGHVDVYSIVKLTTYQCNMVQSKRVLVVLNLELLMPGSKIGKSLLQETANGGNQMAASDPRNAAYQVSVTRPTTNGQTTVNGTAGSRNIHPIESLTPYQNKWCIKARVTDKRPIKTYSNARGEGKLFSITLTDASCEIRATGFNQEVDRFYEMLKEGQVYYIRGGQIKAANRQYSSVNNDYELTFSSDTHIEPCYDDNVDKVPEAKFNFVPFNQLPSRSKDVLIDVVGVLDTVSQCETIISRQSQKELTKRTVRLVDDTQSSIALTLWGDDALNFDSKISSDNLHPVIAVKGVRINDFQGLSLSLSFGGRLFLNPDQPDAFRLRTWYDQAGHCGSFQNLSSSNVGGSGGTSSQFILIGMAQAERLGTGDKPDYFTVKCTVSAMRRENCLYKACPTTDCNKKLVEMAPGSYRCEKCNREYTNFKWRLMLSAQLQDFSGSIWATFFEDTAQTILGHTSEELGDMQTRDEDSYNAAIEKALFKTFAVRLRAKMDTFNDETKIKYSGVKVDPVKFEEYVRFLQEDIKRLESAPTIY